MKSPEGRPVWCSETWCGCGRWSRRTPRPELDIYLGEKDYWGRGYATDAMRTICRYGFEKMGLLEGEFR
jgi:RimJ/RimL family protein N-acetyltransferase